jgi:hypothetical protein
MSSHEIMSEDSYVRVYGLAVLALGVLLLGVINHERRPPAPDILLFSVVIVGLVFVALGGVCVFGGVRTYARIFRRSERSLCSK